MRTQLSRFCKHFENTVRPFLGPLGQAVEALSTDGESPAAALRPELIDIQHQLEVLVEKVAGQQAYVLIFGPLKSGKSTLMNAIAAAYVSEVSSLPAYPCLVFVQHSDKHQYTVTNYNGSTSTYDQPGALHQAISDAHVELVAAMRETEDASQLFDPQEHLPEAIRRVDVKLPAHTLKSAGAVLVDTPGLYTRMRFGYDRMTRDFRNSAACAVFVVKSDTLFLEQVFSEFTQLLTLFSRIFLVVNMDTNKRDVGPDGKLIPSLEQKSPEAIIQAFENLAMSAPLKAAAEEGRVCIYPVDLLRAASNVLKDQPTKAKDRTGFESFRNDLTEYLASSDYLLAFLGDSLQRAHSLVTDVGRQCVSEPVEELRNRLTDLRAIAEDRKRTLAGIEKCLDYDWSKPFARFAEDLEAEVERAARDHGTRLATALSAAVQTWFLSSHSLKWLLESEWLPLIREYCDTVRDAAFRCFEQSCSKQRGGLELDHSIASMTESLGIDVGAHRDAHQPKPKATKLPAAFANPIDYDAIPIRRGVLELVTFKKVDALREKLFGPKSNPDTKVSPQNKESKLGKPVKNYMHDSLMQFKKRLVDATVDSTLKHFGEELRHETIDSIRTALRDLEPPLREELTAAEAETKQLVEVLEPLRKLAKASDSLLAKIHALTTQYTSSDPEELLGRIQPVIIEPKAPPAATQQELDERELRRKRRRESRGTS